jgi:L-fuconolactonase
MDLQPYMITVWNLFGAERIMFGSDWPVCLVAAQYERVKQTVIDFINARSPEDLPLVMGDNAKRFYQL